MIIVTGLLTGAACGGKRQLPGTGGTVGSLGGASGAQGGIGGTASGGMSGAGGAPITSCPASAGTVACSGTFGCTYEAYCTCHGCCSSRWVCDNGVFKQNDFNDGCIQGPMCPDGGGGAGTSGGSAGSSGGGAGGTGVGSGGAGGSDPIIFSCPTTKPTVGTACSGTFGCSYEDLCHCGICCRAYYGCENARITYVGMSDACLMVTCDAGSGTDGPGAVCTPGADQSCNDNLAISSIHGHCTDAGVCECGPYTKNAQTGRCQ